MTTTATPAAIRPAASDEEAFFPAIASPLIYHRLRLVHVAGRGFWDEIMNRMVATTIYSRQQSAVMLDDCLAYLIARGKMANPDEDLVANLLPDQAWHVFQLYNEEYRRFCMSVAGQWLRHDPAQEAALINYSAATAKTVGLFREHRIGYHPELWRDHILFARGAEIVKTGIRVPAA